MLEAERAASLLSEANYFAQKRKFLLDNNAEQVRAAQAEVDRLKQEVLLGADKIDNDRKIADAQAKLNKLRENGATSLQVLAIQEKSGLDTIARAFVDAQEAAKSYLDTISRAAAVEIAGVGKGQKARDLASGLSSLDEKYAQQKLDLQRDNRNGKFAGRPDDYQRELALLNSSQAAEIAIYKAKYAKLEELQKDWAVGATEALTNYYNETQNLAKLTEDAFTNAFKGIEDALVTFATTGKGSFKDLANSIIADIARIAIKQQITGPLANWLSGVIGGASGASSAGAGTDVLGAFIAGLGGRAIGGPVSAGGMYRVNERGPELLDVAGKQYLMMGDQSGDVKAAAAPQRAGSSLVVHYHPQQGETRKTAMQNGRALSDQMAAYQRRAS